MRALEEICKSTIDGEAKGGALTQEAMARVAMKIAMTVREEIADFIYKSGGKGFTWASIMELGESTPEAKDEK